MTQQMANKRVKRRGKQEEEEVVRTKVTLRATNDKNIHHGLRTLSYYETIVVVVSRRFGGEFRFQLLLVGVLDVEARGPAFVLLRTHRLHENDFRLVRLLTVDMTATSVAAAWQRGIVQVGEALVEFLSPSMSAVAVVEFLVPTARHRRVVIEESANVWLFARRLVQSEFAPFLELSANDFHLFMRQPVPPFRQVWRGLMDATTILGQVRQRVEIGGQSLHLSLAHPRFIGNVFLYRRPRPGRSLSQRLAVLLQLQTNKFID